MPGAGFEPAVPESEWPQSHALYRAAAMFGMIPSRNLSVFMNVITWRHYAFDGSSF